MPRLAGEFCQMQARAINDGYTRAILVYGNLPPVPLRHGHGSPTPACAGSSRTTTNMTPIAHSMRCAIVRWTASAGRWSSGGQPGVIE